MIDSKIFNKFEGDLSLLEIDINDEMRYYDGDRVSSSRSGYSQVNGLRMFELAVKARVYADALINAADCMDLRIKIALGKQTT